MDQQAQSRAFHLGDLVSVITHRLVSPDHIGGVYNVVDYVTGQAHMTHQLPRAIDEIAPWLIDQHPWLALVSVPDWVCDKPTVDRWLSAEVAIRGEYHEVLPMPLGMYAGRDPIAEMQELAPHAQVIGVVTA